MKLEPKQIIDKRYQIVERIGQGGMGEVWKATDQRMGDEVVLKSPLAQGDEDSLRRFGREAQTMARFAAECVHILDIRDVGMLDDVPYYVMRYQAGGSLSDRIDPVALPEKATFEPDQFEWLTCIASALDYLHGEHFFHRDVKPANILFSAGGTPFLVDFGIAKDVNSMTQSLTIQGATVGTLAYMAPEVLQGEDYTPQADQYSLAATLYESLVGNKPYDGSTPFALFQAWQKDYRKLIEIFPQIPVAASDVLDQALATKADQRFDSCLGFARQFVDGLKTQNNVPVVEDSPKRPLKEVNLVDIPEADDDKTANVPLLFPPPSTAAPTDRAALPRLSKYHNWWMFGLLVVMLSGTTLLAMFCN
jgi:serine/threonine-protein kinase